LLLRIQFCQRKLVFGRTFKPFSFFFPPQNTLNQIANLAWWLLFGVGLCWSPYSFALLSFLLFLHRVFFSDLNKSPPHQTLAHLGNTMEGFGSRANKIICGQCGCPPPNIVNRCIHLTCFIHSGTSSLVGPQTACKLVARDTVAKPLRHQIVPKNNTVEEINFKSVAHLIQTWMDVR